MREVPMLFNTKMVAAILDGIKTQTRRLIKGLPLTEPYATVEDGKLLISDENGEWYPAEQFSRIQPGDILWVRETWCYRNFLDNEAPRFAYKASEPRGNEFIDQSEPVRVGPGPYDICYHNNSGYIPWRPSIHMPREAARLFLKVKDVRAERLKDISEDDAIAEGASGGEYLTEDNEYIGVYYPHEDFARIWDSTIQKAYLPCYGWEANPWVWRIEFERMEVTTWNQMRV